jgi:hypothetical protein
MTDHDWQLPRVGHASYGEAVETMSQGAVAARPGLFRLAESEFRLFGQ